VNTDLPQRLAARLAQPLPGWHAQATFQPELSFGRHRGPASPNARAAAVLLVIYPHEGAWHMPLIRRPADMPYHPGQVSFPGGMIEPGEDGRQAALREYTEELGAPAHELQVLGRLTELYLFASNHTVEPWLAATRVRPAWEPCAREVDLLLEVPVSHLLDRESLGSIIRANGELSFVAPCFLWHSDAIWGATSMILAELLAVLEGCEL
jgi:8-oxo-dGTP pyrophosphatase MutT (NUDIX family)